MRGDGVRRTETCGRHTGLGISLLSRRCTLAWILDTDTSIRGGIDVFDGRDHCELAATYGLEALTLMNRPGGIYICVQLLFRDGTRSRGVRPSVLVELPVE